MRFEDYYFDAQFDVFVLAWRGKRQLRAFDFELVAATFVETCDDETNGEASARSFHRLRGQESNATFGLHNSNLAGERFDFPDHYCRLEFGRDVVG